MTAFSLRFRKVPSQQFFMLSSLVVNGGNYLYNLVLGRMLGPEAFADAALMITLLLVLSFAGMTFQMVVAKFTAELNDSQQTALHERANGYALFIGSILGLGVALLSPQLQEFLQTENAQMFQVFGIGIPFYFLMSINRGQLQGKQHFNKLSFSYQSEMWGRLLLTLAILICLPTHDGLGVAIGILASIILGLFPIKKIRFTLFSSTKLDSNTVKLITNFALVTAFYELTQILINNSDILMVKRFFEAKEAGLYASLALVGRAVYFIAWMFIMLLLPAVVNARKEGRATTPLLFKAILHILLLSLAIVSVCGLYPELIIEMLFGSTYLPISHLLWRYVLAATLFALANLFVYYFLSLDLYKPIAFAAFFGLAQVVVLYLFHSSLTMMVNLQILAMTALLICQIIYFLQHQLKGDVLNATSK